MSLYQEADGILDTHVTWDDIEKDLQKNLGTKATFGENKKVTNIGDKKGYMSMIACIEPDWQNAEDHQLPRKLAVKISSQIAMVKLTKMMKIGGDDGLSDEKMHSLGKLVREAHNREVTTYKLLQRFNHPDIPYTKVYSLKPFDGERDLKGYIIVDFIPNVHSTEMFRSIPSDDLISVVRGVATFSALCETLSPEEKNFALGINLLELLFQEFFNGESLNRNFEMLRGYFDKNDSENCERLIEVFQKCVNMVTKYTTISETLGFKLILNHGDLWQANMIHSLGEDGKLKLEAMIDWQTVARMPPGLDMTRLIMGCLSGKDRRENEQNLLKLYHQTFIDVLGREVFSFQELQDSYNLFAPMTAMVLMPTFAHFLEAANLPEDEKVKAKKSLMEKMIVMMEDVIEIDRINTNKFPDFFNV